MIKIWCVRYTTVRGGWVLWKMFLGVRRNFPKEIKSNFVSE